VSSLLLCVSSFRHVPNSPFFFFFQLFSPLSTFTGPFFPSQDPRNLSLPGRFPPSGSFSGTQSSFIKVFWICSDFGFLLASLRNYFHELFLVPILLLAFPCPSFLCIWLFFKSSLPQFTPAFLDLPFSQEPLSAGFLRLSDGSLDTFSIRRSSLVF